MLKLISGFILSLLLAGNLLADDRRVRALLHNDAAPTGVVFEIVTSSPGALKWAFPQVREYMTKLREKFPGLHIAVVSHGQEQFALVSKKQKQLSTIHEQAKAINGDKNTELHVCGTFAGWRGLAPEDFPDYVDVSATGPAQINDYKSLGYEHIIVRRRGSSLLLQ